MLASAIGLASAINVSVTIGNLSGGTGVTSGGIYVGNFPITITSGSTHQDTIAYCMDFDGTVNVGHTYTASITSPPDNAAWKSIGYILTWHDPGNNDNAAAAVAVAIWKLLDPTVDLGPISTSIKNAGNALISEASGKDVVRSGDTLRWVSPSITDGGTVSANPGQTLSFIAKVANSFGTARPGVNLNFSATIVSSGAPLSVTPSSAITDSNGQATVTVTVPLNSIPADSIKVIASTKGVSVQQYLYLTGYDHDAQNIIGLDTSFGLTCTTEVSIRGFIFVLPEGPLGALSAIGTFALAFGCFAVLRKKRLRI